MAAKKIEDLCVAVRKYTDRDGKEKNQYENVGHVLQMDDGSKMLCIKRSFNPAGVPHKDGSDTIIISRFAVKDKDAAQQSAPAQQQPSSTPAGVEDDIPF